MAVATTHGRSVVTESAGVAVALMLISAGPVRADSTPIGPLPAGPTRGDTSAKALKSATHKIHSA